MNLPISTCLETIDVESRNITKSHYLVLCVANSILAVPTAIANTLVIMAILTTSSLQKPSYLLLTSLAFSDVAVGCVGQPIFIAAIKLFMVGNAEVYCRVRTISASILIFLILTSVLTITVISVDRYLAIRLKIRYKTVVTIRRTRLLVIALWVTSIIILLVLPFNIEISLLALIGGIGLFICLFVILFSYTMSFRALKIQCAQIQPQVNQQPNVATQSNTIDVLKYKKLLNTMLLILALIFICYLPMTGVFVVFSAPHPNRAIAWGLQTIVCLNSTLNPFIYITRMREIRQACIKILRWFIK